MRDNLEEGKLDLAEDVRWHCKKNSLSVLSCIGNRTREGCDRRSEHETADEAEINLYSSSSTYPSTPLMKCCK